jgi:colanic acid/amylovoran biosynthesis glycosyltransferase
MSDQTRGVQRPMRVAFFTGAFPMTSETFVVNAAKKVLDSGHQLDIYAIDPTIRQKSEVQRTVERYGMLDMTFSPDVPKSDIAKFGALAKAFGKTRRKHGRKAFRLLTRPSPDGPRTSARAILDSSALKRDARYDVIHVHFGQLAGRVLQLRRAGLLEGKVLVHFRGSDISSHVKSNGEDVYRHVFAAADGFAANCRFFRDKAVRLGAPEKRTFVLPSGLDTSGFTFEPRLNPEKGPVRLIAVGRLVEKKGFCDLLDALALIPDGDSVHLTIIGDGVLRSDLEGQADRLGIAGRVTFMGAQSLDRVAEELARSHIFVGPSVTAADGNQDAPINTLKEAMASGCPVVATRHGGIPELVEDGVSGYLVPERDPKALAEALQRLLSQPETWPEMGRKGAQKVATDYDLETTGETMMAIYRSLMDDTGRTT